MYNLDLPRKFSFCLARLCYLIEQGNVEVSREQVKLLKSLINEYESSGLPMSHARVDLFEHYLAVFHGRPDSYNRACEYAKAISDCKTPKDFAKKAIKIAHTAIANKWAIYSLDSIIAGENNSDLQDVIDERFAEVNEQAYNLEVPAKLIAKVTRDYYLSRLQDAKDVACVSEDFAVLFDDLTEWHSAEKAKIYANRVFRAVNKALKQTIPE